MLRHVISTNGGTREVLRALDLSGEDLVNLGLWVSRRRVPPASNVSRNKHGDL